MSTRYQTVVEIDFPVTGTRRYSFRGVWDSAAIYRSLMAEIGSVSRGISMYPGKYKPTTIALGFNNYENEFSILKSTDSFCNAAVRLYRATTGGALALVVSGTIAEWSIDEKTFALRTRDILFDRLDVPLERTLVYLSKITFPDMPADQEPRLVPVIYGTNALPTAAVTSSVGPATIPCYLIDPAISQAKYRYVVAQHACDSVLRVFNYETLLAASAYTVTTATYGGVLMTVLDLNADPRNAARKRDLEITADVSGITDGGLLENPADQLEHFLINYAPEIVSGDLDVAGFAAAQTACSDANYKGAFALLNRDWSFLDVLDHFSASFFLPIYIDDSSKISCSLVTRDIGTPAETVTETADILKSSFRISSNARENLSSHIQYFTEFNWSRGFFWRQRSITVAGEEGRIGRQIVKDVKLLFVRDATTAKSVARAFAAYSREDVHLIEFKCEIGRLSDFYLNDWLSLTHSRGIAASGGYTAKPVRVLKADFIPDPETAYLLVEAVAIPEPAASVNAWLESGLWTHARPEQSVMISELVPLPDPSSYATDGMLWGLHVGGDEYAGEISSLRG